MKWFKYFVFLLSATMLVSCGGDGDGDEGGDGDKKLVDVMFQVDFSNSKFVNHEAVNTHSNGDGLKVDVLKVGFYAIDGSSNIEKEFAVSSETFDVMVSLEPGKVYNAIFWAQCGECEAYDVSNLSMIKMKKPLIASLEGIEKMDAYYGICKGIEVNEVGVVYDVKMKRPLAQVSVGTTGKWSDSKIKFVNVPVAFSPLDGRVVAKSDLEFSCVVTPHKVANFSVDGVEYQYIGLAYMFAPQDKTEVSYLMTIIDGKNETTHAETMEIQVNYKSVICGDFTNK